MDASLVGGQELGNSLNIKDIQFNGVNNADLGGKSLTGSTGYQDSFEITFQGITANGIAVEDLNTTIKANGNAELSGADNNTWTISGLNKLTGADGQENEKTYTFTGLGQVAFAKDEAVLNGRGSDTFEFQSGGLLEAASMNFKTAHLKQVNNTNKVVTHADAFLQSDNNAVVSKSLKTNGVIFTDVNTADLGGKFLTGSSATDSFVITSEGITANDIAVKNLNTTIDANGDAVLSGASRAWQLIANKNELGSDGYTFTGLTKANLADKGLQGSAEHNHFTVNGNKKLDAAGIEFIDVTSVVGHDNKGTVITNADAGLAANKNALNTQGIAFTGIKTADLGGHKLTASAEQNTFNVTDESALNAAAIAFTGVNTVAGDANKGAVTTNADAGLTENKNALTTQKIEFIGIKTADLGGHKLTASAEQNTFNVKGENALTAAAIDFTGVNTVAGDANKGAVTTNADAGLAANKNALNTQGIAFTDIKTADLGGHKLTASAEQNTFNVKGENALTAAAIDFTGVNTVAGDANKGAVTTNADAGLTADAHSLLTHGITLSGIKTANLSDKKLTASSAYNNFNLVEDNKLTIAGIDFSSVKLIDGYKNTGTLTTNADASLTADAFSLTTHGITLSGIKTANLSDKKLTASVEHNVFNVTGEKALTAADIAFTGVNTVAGNANNGEVTTNADADLTANKNALNTQGIAFTGIKTADLSSHKLTASAQKNTFNVTDENALTAADIAFTGVNAVAGNANNGEVTTNANAGLTANKDALSTQVIAVTGIKTADLGGHKLTASAQQNTFNVTGENALTAADIVFTGVNTVAGDANKGEVTTNADADLTADKNALTTQKIEFIGIKTADLGGHKLTASAEHITSNVTGENALTAADIVFTDVNTVAGDANKGEVTTNADADLTADKNALTTQKIEFIGIKTADLGGQKLTASAEQNAFNVTGEKALTAADIAFTGVNAVAGNANNGEVTTNADAGLAANKNALNTQGIAFKGIKTADLGGYKLAASAQQNAFNVTGEKALTAADINFTGVSTVAGKDNKGTVITNADASLTADAFLGEKENALNTQSITFTGIKTADLGGQTLIGSKSHDSFKIFTNGNGVNANDIEIVNLDRTINVNGTASLSGAQNNTWQLTNTTNTLEDSRDNGFIFIGVNAANLQCETLNASAAQNKFDITGAQKLTAADIDFSIVAEVNAYDNKGYVITNNVAVLTDGKNQLKTQWVIINGVDQAYLSNNALKGSATGSTLELISESRVDASGIKFFDFGELDGYENTGALVSKLDAPQWTMTTANSGTVNNINFKAFKTLENSVGDLKLNVGEKVGGVEFKGDNINFGGNSSLVFNSQNNVTVNSINNINGSLVAKDLNINTTGDVDLKTQIDSITLNANNANLVQEGDLVIHSIDVGRTLNLNSADAGKNNLIAGNSGRINVKAKASLGEQGKWDNIGVNAQPLSFEVVSELALVANTTVDPFFPSGQPLIFNLKGDRSESLLSSHTNALIQNNRVSNDENANLALFEALSPIYIDKNAVAGVHVKDSRLDVPSELEMEMLAALLSTENPTAAGKPNKKKVLEKDDADET